MLEHHKYNRVTFFQINKSNVNHQQVNDFEKQMHLIHEKLKQCKDSNDVEKLVNFIKNSKELNMNNKSENKNNNSTINQNIKPLNLIVVEPNIISNDKQTNKKNNKSVKK